MMKSIICNIIRFKGNTKQESYKTTKIKLIQLYCRLLLINQWCILCSPSNARLSDEFVTENSFIKGDGNLSEKSIFESKFKSKNLNVEPSSAQSANTSLFTAERNLLPSRLSTTENNFFYLNSEINEMLNTIIPGLFDACREMKDLHEKINAEIIEMKRKPTTSNFLKIIEQIIKEKQEVYLDFEEKINDLRSNAEKLSLIYKKATLVYQKIKTSLNVANLDSVREHIDLITLKIFDGKERLSRNLNTVKKTFEEDKKQADTIFKILSKFLLLKPAELKNDTDVKKLISSLE